jgi:DNA-binding transcriptional LysR family regulator
VLEDLFAKFPFRPQIVMETSSLSMMGAILAESACITILSRSQTSKDSGRIVAGSVELVVLPLMLGWQDRSIGITTRAEWLPTPVQSQFLDIITRISRTA